MNIALFKKCTNIECIIEFVWILNTPSIQPKKNSIIGTNRFSLKCNTAHSVDDNVKIIRSLKGASNLNKTYLKRNSSIIDPIRAINNILSKKPY